jgi:uncharacterized OsmC-like protein
MLEVNPRLKAYAEGQLSGQHGPKPGAPERPFTTIQSKALHNLQLRATVEGHGFLSDEREDACGNDAGPAPMRYFLAGVMMCHQVWTIKSAVIEGVQLDRLECEMRGFLERASDGPSPDGARGLSRVGYTVNIDSPASADQVWSVVDLATTRCPAFVTFARAARVDLELVHNGERLGERSYGKAG